MSDEFSLVDCSIAPILWRLPRWEVDLPPSHGRNIIKYAETLFSRPSFRASLTELEQEMRP
jgi:stringent starvation protein A